MMQNNFVIKDMLRPPQEGDVADEARTSMLRIETQAFKQSVIVRILIQVLLHIFHNHNSTTNF